MHDVDMELMESYLQESREHLVKTMDGLLHLETPVDSTSLKQLQNIFRGIHFIRGGASLLDLEVIQNLARHIENVLDLMGSREILFSQEVADILRISCEKLMDLIDHYEHSEQIDLGECQRALRELTSRHLRSQSEESLSNRIEICLPDGKAILDISEFDLRHALQNHRPLYLVQYDLIRDLQRQNKTPLETYRKLATAGRILECKLDFQAVGTLEDELVSGIPFNILYSCMLPIQELLNLLEISGDCIFLCSEWKEKAKQLIAGPLTHD